MSDDHAPVDGGRRPPTLLLVIASGTAARFLLHTDVLPTLLAAGARVVAMSPHHDDPGVLAHLDGQPVELEPLRLPTRSSGARGAVLRALVRSARRSALNGRRTPFFTVKYGRWRRSMQRDWPRRITVPLHFVITQIAWRSRWARRALLKADLALYENRDHSDIFERVSPDLVVSTSLGWTRSEERVLQEAAKRGIPIASLVQGWDNPSSKGYRAIDPDLVVAWSARMRDELASLHDVPLGRIRVGGVPHWDLYATEGGTPSREELFDRLGLDPDRKLLVYATSFPRKKFPDAEVAATLAEAIEAGELGSAQLLIRLHPKAMGPDGDGLRGAMADLAAAHEHVTVNVPMTASASLPSHPHRGDAEVLGGLMTHCDVLVNVFSTTTIEAFVNDRPVVMVTPGACVPAGETAVVVAGLHRWEEYQHLRPVVEQEAAKVAWSREDLLRHVRAYLEDPALDREPRQRIAATECGPFDGRSGQRTARIVLEQLGWPSGTPARPPSGELRAGAPT